MTGGHHHEHHGFLHRKASEQPGNHAPSYNAKEEVKAHKHKKHLAEAGTLAAGAFALHEKHEAKKHPEHAHRHKVEQSIAEAVAVGMLGVTFHEGHEVKHAKKEAKKHHF
ncbi:hypothetical protein O6H91_07G031700 [Diphasiastrum complanatum]|uniref:Uncharacterized protein n=1 Tax=Diphasiastrum complanatum TaxID=34168 RepID=A0ACC2D3Z0_DIPCM|nr:hypothetical protein O6H91_07G031700 [Diphasiastrum complanatum]